jgi:phosphomethylpyrimidine synthase
VNAIKNEEQNTLIIRGAKYASFAHFCSMKSIKISWDVRDYANAQNIEAEKALAAGMSEKAAEFKATGSEIYHGAASKEPKADH